MKEIKPMFFFLKFCGVSVVVVVSDWLGNQKKVQGLVTFGRAFCKTKYKKQIQSVFLQDYRTHA